jgi:hypothetical protein
MNITEFLNSVAVVKGKVPSYLPLCFMYYLNFSISVSLEQELFLKFGGIKEPLHKVAFNSVP